MSTINNTP